MPFSMESIISTRQTQTCTTVEAWKLLRTLSSPTSPALLVFPSLQEHIPWNSSRQVHEQLRLFSPEDQGCDPAIDFASPLSGVIFNYLTVSLTSTLGCWKKPSTIPIKSLESTKKKGWFGDEGKPKGNRNKTHSSNFWPPDNPSLSTYSKNIAHISLATITFYTCPYYFTSKNNICEL